MDNIKYSKEVSEFIEGNSSKKDNYYFFPFYFEKVGENVFTIHPLDKLPEDLKQQIINERENQQPDEQG